MFMKHRIFAFTTVTTAFLMALSPAANAAPNPQGFSTRDTSSLPVVYLSGANDVAPLNVDVKKNITAAGMQFFEWDPLKTSLKESPTRNLLRPSPSKCLRVYLSPHYSKNK